MLRNEHCLAQGREYETLPGGRENCETVRGRRRGRQKRQKGYEGIGDIVSCLCPGKEERGDTLFPVHEGGVVDFRQC